MITPTVSYSSKEFDGFIYVAVAIYLTLVIYHGNAEIFVKLMAEQHGFLKWMLSAIILYWLWKSQPAGIVVAGIAGLGLLAAAMKALGNKDVAKLVEDF